MVRTLVRSLDRTLVHRYVRDYVDKDDDVVRQHILSLGSRVCEQVHSTPAKHEVNISQPCRQMRPPRPVMKLDPARIAAASAKALLHRTLQDTVTRLREAIIQNDDQGADHEYIKHSPAEWAVNYCMRVWGGGVGGPGGVGGGLPCIRMFLTGIRVAR